jgi:hypothetical protein
MYDPADVDPAEAMLGQLAGLELTLARHVHACAMATEDPHEVAELARAYQRIARSMRQSLALHARFKRQRESDEREHPRPPPAPLKPMRDDARIAARKAGLRAAARRLLWTEYERCDHAEPCDFDLIDERLELQGRDDAFGLEVTGQGWGQGWDVEPLDAHLVRFCAGLGLAEAAVRAWRDLPDPPPEILEAEAPPWRSSA